MTGYACPTCEVDLEYVVFEAASAYRGRKEIQLLCPHCQDELLFLQQDSGVLYIKLKESERE